MTAKTTKEAKPIKDSISVFRITGIFRKGKNSQRFTQELVVKNKQEAEEQVLSIIGSKHRAKRREINIEKIEKIPVDKVNNPIVKQMIGGK